MPGKDAMKVKSNWEKSASPEAGSGSCRRTTGRRQQEDLVCDLGPIVDLSRGGMRVLSRRRLRGKHKLTLTTLEGTLTIRGRVAWSRRMGLRRHLAGIEFIDVDDATAEELTRISTVHARCFRMAS